MILSLKAYPLPRPCPLLDLIAGDPEDYAPKLIVRDLSAYLSAEVRSLQETLNVSDRYFIRAFSGARDLYKDLFCTLRAPKDQSVHEVIGESFEAVLENLCGLPEHSVTDPVRIYGNCFIAARAAHGDPAR